MNIEELLVLHKNQCIESHFLESWAKSTGIMPVASVQALWSRKKSTQTFNMVAQVITITLLMITVVLMLNKDSDFAFYAALLTILGSAILLGGSLWKFFNACESETAHDNDDKSFGYRILELARSLNLTPTDLLRLGQTAFREKRRAQLDSDFTYYLNTVSTCGHFSNRAEVDRARIRYLHKLFSEFKGVDTTIDTLMQTEADKESHSKEENKTPVRN